MCGIAGLVHIDGSAVNRTSLDRLTDALAHRGPDGRGTYRSAQVGLGHRRLSILDLSDAGSQPMCSEDGLFALTFNGEIYNFAELRRELEQKGHHFRSRSDTEVLLRLYMQEGKACLTKLRGMFAFAIHDRKRNILFLARDRVGKKPLKYFVQGSVFAFASELKALRTLESCPRSVDHEAIFHFLTMMYLPAQHTGIEGIRKLPAAHSLTLDLETGQHTLERYWELRYETDRAPSKAEWQARILEVFRESVRLRMVADVPVGAFLSGGIDSAAIVALMSELSPHPVRTFSIGSEDESRNELPDAARIAQRFGTEHHPIVLQPDIVHLLPELVHTYEEPYADPSLIPTYLVSRFTRKSVTVALNGDGGDENFAGYVRYPILKFSEYWRHMPLPLHGLVRTGTDVFHAYAQSTFSYRCQRFQHSIHLPWEQRFLQYISFFTEEEKRAILRDDVMGRFPRTDAWFAARTLAARERAPDLLHRALSMDVESYLADDLMPKVDLGSMAHGLEARSPLLDHHLLELTARLPARYQLRGLATKWIFKDLLKTLLPHETLTKRKRGFRLPLDRWFRGELRGFLRERLLEPSPLFWDLFDRRKVEVFLRAYHESKIDYSDHLWALLWLGEWLRQYA